jgi:heterotetrameric sarcosine oxidase gamma subunit
MLDVSLPALAASDCFRPMPLRQIFSLAAFRTTRPALEAALGLELPSTPCRVVHGGSVYLWNGPNAWLVIGGDTIAEKTAGIAAVTDQSDGLFLFALSGPHAVRILKKLVPIDVESFAPDEVAITLAAHMGVRLWREGDDFILACFRGFAGALHHALAEAAQEFLPGRG